MGNEGSTETQDSIRRVIFYATIFSGCIAAYLMYRRGASLGKIAKQAIASPIGSLASEVKNAV